MYSATQENVDSRLNGLSSISKNGTAANFTSAPGGQRSRYATGGPRRNIATTFCTEN